MSQWSESLLNPPEFVVNVSGIHVQFNPFTKNVFSRHCCSYTVRYLHHQFILTYFL